MGQFRPLLIAIGVLLAVSYIGHRDGLPPAGPIPSRASMFLRIRGESIGSGSHGKESIFRTSKRPKAATFAINASSRIGTAPHAPEFGGEPIISSHCAGPAPSRLQTF